MANGSTHSARGPGEPMSATMRLMPEEFCKSVIQQALQHRPKTPQTLRRSFDAALRRYIELNGFRDSSRAQVQKLLPAVFWEVDNGNDHLASLVLQSWDRANKPTRELVAKYLAGKNVAVDAPDYKARCFRTYWSEEEWHEHRVAFKSGHGDASDDEIALMLCLVSGKAPEVHDGSKIESPLFREMLDTIEGTTCDSRDWLDAYAFADAVKRIANDKGAELVDSQTGVLEDQLSKVGEKFDDELKYLGINVEGWFEQVQDRLDILIDAQAVVADMQERLEKYQPLRPQAPSRDEERMRARQRLKAEDEVLEAAGAWQQLLRRPRPEELAEERAEYVAEEPDDRIAKEVHDKIVAERDALMAEVTELRQDSVRLEKKANDAADARNHLSEENGALKRQLTESQDSEQYWRHQFIALKGRAPATEEEPLAPLTKVSEALDRAQEQFAEELLISLNSKSRRNNNPFEKPEEVFEALAWLATEFRRMRPNPGASPDFNKMIKEACPGWFYKPNQTETTMGQFSEWYRTTVDGKVYELANHIGKGNSFNPKSTIRIAFAWDGEQNKVVVGFLGLHQKNRQS